MVSEKLNPKSTSSSKNVKVRKTRTKANQEKNDKPKPPPRKRGRKPKGGKLIETMQINTEINAPEPNIVLHLKCRLKDLDDNTFLNASIHNNFAKTNSNSISSYKLEQKQKKLSYNVIHNINQSKVDFSNSNEYTNTDEQYDKLQTISKKLYKLAKNLKTDTIADNKSHCFWCTCSFDNPPVYIPKGEFNGSYHCYGCFCSPECATAYLFQESIDSATRFERYHLLNYIYCNIYEHKKNIKPAPDPRYTLDKFYGNLTIQEYRQLLENERLLLVVNKPLTRVLPELHEDNDNYILEPGAAISNSKFKLRRKTKPTKAQILGEKFNLHAVAS